MIKNKFGELVYSQDDLCSLIMQGTDTDKLNGIMVDDLPDLERASLILENIPSITKYNSDVEQQSVDDFDRNAQSQWFMPREYYQLDIAKHVLDLCTTDEELQRVGQELLLYQERGLFDLLRYLKYLVDVMQQNKLVWGVGRGSSVASYVLYLLGIHKVNSMFYDLDPTEFLR